MATMEYARAVNHAEQTVIPGSDAVADAGLRRKFIAWRERRPAMRAVDETDTIDGGALIDRRPGDHPHRQGAGAAILTAGPSRNEILVGECRIVRDSRNLTSALIAQHEILKE